MDNMLEGIKGARAIIDDILIAGENEEEHDVMYRRQDMMYLQESYVPCNWIQSSH